MLGEIILNETHKQTIYSALNTDLPEYKISMAIELYDKFYYGHHHHWCLPMCRRLLDVSDDIKYLETKILQLEDKISSTVEYYKTLNVFDPEAEALVYLCNTVKFVF